MIYLDNSATTRPFDEVIDKMSACMREEYFNPSAVYAPAMLAGRILTETREAIASQLGGRVKVVFTSGGTEADNLALLGTAACLGLYLLNRRLAAEGLYSAARRHAHAWVAGILTAAMCLTLLIDAVTVNSSWMDNPDAWANFTDFAAFQQWCEEQAANGKNEQSDENAGAQIAAYYYDENGNEVPIQDVFRATVYDPKSDYKRALGEINTAGLLGWTVYSAGDTVIFRGSTEELQAPIRAAYQTKLQIIRLLLCLEPLLALAAWLLIGANYPSHARNGKK